MGGFIDDLFGGGGSDAASDAARIQADFGSEAIQTELAARERAQGFFEPFAGVARRGIDESSFLANPQAQFDFLQNNPLFQLSLENANRRTEQGASASRRLSFGDTLQSLSNNVLLAASPLIDRQRQDITNLLQFGGDIATSQANIETGSGARVGDIQTSIGNSLAAGEIGAANARASGAQNILQTALLAGGIFSDERLKTHKRKLGSTGQYTWWSWTWNDLATTLFGLVGTAQGVMAGEVIKINPDAVILDASGYYKVNYGSL